MARPRPRPLSPTLTGQGAAIDTTTAAGKLVFRIFAALAMANMGKRQTLYRHVAPNGALRPEGKKILAPV
jgi:hypothetical protein